MSTTGSMTADPGSSAPTPSDAEASVAQDRAPSVPGGVAVGFETWQALLPFYGEYGRLLDAGEFARWPDFFTDDAVYRVQSRENFDRGLPLATIALESRGMLKDRVFGATDTIYHDPYAQRHVIGLPVVREVRDDGFLVEAAYLVIRTRRDAMPEILSVGRYLDRIARTPDGLRLAERQCIFDNDLLPNSLIYPI